MECIHLCFLPRPYKTAPIVYARPPVTNNTSPAVGNNTGNKFTLNIIAHPIPKQHIMENFLYFFKSIAFRTIPKIAIAQITPNIVQPVATSYSLNVHSAKGVYEPAISKNIVQWSNTCITFFPFASWAKPMINAGHCV